MSLFRAREWWTARAGDAEEFGHGSMAVGNVNNDPDGSVKIVTGSLHGVLRVHYPNEARFKIEDLLLEEDLEAPILQLLIGCFIPAAEGIKAIAVLHPRKLGVYTMEAVGGQRSKASHHKLVKVYEHVLGSEGGGHFTAYNMAHGGFGGVPRDLLCVQSMDGRVQVFEQDAHIFTRRLLRVVAPGPLCYVAHIDAFVVGNSQMGIDCYKYQALAASQGDREEGKDEGISAARGLQAYWSCRLGEPALDIFVAKFSRALGPGCVDIVVLGEKTLFTLREQGTIRLQKVLGYEPLCACKYTVVAAPGDAGAGLAGTTVHEGEEGFATVIEEENIMIGSGDGRIMVYKDMQLVWQASLRRVPVSLTVARCGLVMGLVVTLDNEGTLTLCYQGTDPPTTAVLTADTKQLDYNEMDREHRELLQVIRRSRMGPDRPAVGKLTIKAQIPRRVDHLPPQQRMQGPETERELTPSGWTSSDEAGIRKVTGKVVVTYHGMGQARHATLNVCAPQGTCAHPSTILLSLVRGASSVEDSSSVEEDTQPAVTEISFLVTEGCHILPSTLLAEASVVCMEDNGEKCGAKHEPMSARCEFFLPLCLVGRAVTGKAGGEHSHTFNTDQKPVPIHTLFEDVDTIDDGRMSQERRLRNSDHDGAGRMLSPNDDPIDAAKDGRSAMLFRYWAVDPVAGSSQDVMVSVAKDCGQYLVESDSFPALCALANELVRRLRQHFGELERGGSLFANAEPRVRIHYTDTLPLRAFFVAIDEHFERRMDLRNALKRLNSATHQYRVIEKRLLSRFKDRNPSLLDHLDSISHETFMRLNEFGEQVDKAQAHLAASAGDLACGTHLLALLVECRFQLSSRDHAILLAHLCPNVAETDGHGWEEHVDEAMTYLLRTSLAKVAKETLPAGAWNPSPLAMPENTARVKKHISMVCDRLNKGASLRVRPAKPQCSSRLPSRRVDALMDQESHLSSLVSPRREASETLTKERR